jgi:glycosyltransferase involved in cell wall biosynthesis
MDSLYTNLSDIHLLNRITCCDDSSSDEDRETMRRDYPEIQFIYNNISGHANSLRALYQRLRSQYVIQWEDDFIVKTKGNHLTRCMNILQTTPVDSVIMRYCNGIEKHDKYGKYYLKQYDPTRTMTREEGFKLSLGQPNWPGWSANCSVQSTHPLQSLDYPTTKNHEFAFSFLYYKSGFRVAHIDRDVVQHIGHISAYDLNNSSR